MTASLAALSARDADAVLNTVIAVEESVDPVPQAQYQALADPALRDRRPLAAVGAGRTLVRVGDAAWISGYDDTVADRLAAEGTGVLARSSGGAHLLLHAVAIHHGTRHDSRHQLVERRPPRTDVDTLTANRDRRLNERAGVRAALRRLHRVGVLQVGHRSKLLPGPQFRRLTEHRTRMVWENLIVAGPRRPRTSRAIHRRRGVVENV